MKYLLLLSLFFGLFPESQAQDSLDVQVVGRWFDTNLPPSDAFENTYNEIWGFVHGGKEYAVIGSTMGTHIFDVTDPANLLEADFIPGADAGGHIIHRDYDTYDHYLYMVAQEGISSLQIADFSYLPDSVHVVYDSSNLLYGAHNIFIDTAMAKLYSCFVINNGALNQIEVYSLADPENPTHLAVYNGIPEVHDFYVWNDTMFANGGTSGFFVVDFSDPLNPLPLGSMSLYPDAGYNHSGWPTHDGYYYLADENHGLKLKTVDVSDFSDITAVGTFGSEVDPQSIPHNLILHGNFLYVSYYHDGLWVFDISDRENPQVAGFYDTYPFPDHSSYRGAWGVYPFLPSGNILVSDMQSGLFVLDVSTALSVPEAGEQKGLKIFPNPSRNQFFLECDLPQGSNISWAMHDPAGRVVHSGEGAYTSPLRIQWPDELAPGLYFISVLNHRYLQAQPLIKQH